MRNETLSGLAEDVVGHGVAEEPFCVAFGKSTCFRNRLERCPIMDRNGVCNTKPVYSVKANEGIVLETTLLIYESQDRESGKCLTWLTARSMIDSSGLRKDI